MSRMPPRFEIASDDIERVVTRFYARIRVHDVLGPVFGAHVNEWREHESKIAGFWKKSILLEAGYEGNPMQVHHRTPEVKAEHFALWLALFDEVLRAELPEQTAASWSALAHRIGRGLRIGIETRDAPKGSVPLFS